MKYTEPLNHLFLLLIIISIGILLTSCVNWTPVEYMDSPIKEAPLEKVVLIDDCFLGSSSDECSDFYPKCSNCICNMDLCT